MMVDQERTGEELVKRDLITREDLAKAKELEAASGTPWYRLLLQMRKVGFSVVEDLLVREFHPKSTRAEHESLGQTMLRLGAISPSQLEEALAEQNRSGRLLGNILLDRGFVTRQTISIALSKQYGMEYVELDAMASEASALDRVPESMAKKNQMIPVRVDGDKLTVLINNPQVRDHLEEVGILLGLRVHPMLTNADDIRAEITKRYHVAKTNAHAQEPAAPQSGPKQQYTVPLTPKAAPKAPAQETSEMKNTATENSKDSARFEGLAQEASGMPVIKLVTTILEGAINSGATDVHLDPQEPEMRVRYRIDGVLHDVMSIPSDIENHVVSQVKIRADMDITERRHPQDGHIRFEHKGKSFDIRVASLPTVLGERVVLRVLDQSSILSGIKDLGLEQEDEDALMRAIAQPYGMILVTGPTGSGKTTTLYASLNQKNVMTDSIVTLEDPVEYQLSGINQVEINTDIDLTFANTLRAAMRQDIDVLLVGEIRDADTARTAIRAAMTGHLVFSTLHTNDAAEAIATLRNMGIPSYLIASALTAVVGQRLVRKICPECKEQITPPKDLVRALGLPESTRKLYKGKGCPACYHTGCKDRTGIYEILEITPEIRKLIVEEKPITEIVTASKMKSMADRCRAKVKAGAVPPLEYVRVIRV